LLIAKVDHRPWTTSLNWSPSATTASSTSSGGSRRPACSQSRTSSLLRSTQPTYYTHLCSREHLCHCCQPLTSSQPFICEPGYLTLAETSITMATDPFSPAYSPFLSSADDDMEQGEWVWVPKKLAATLPAAFSASSHSHPSPDLSQQMYHSFTSEPTASSPESASWNASPEMPASPNMMTYDFRGASAGLSNSPAAELPLEFDSFHVNLALQIPTTAAPAFGTKPWLSAATTATTTGPLFPTAGLDAAIFPGNLDLELDLGLTSSPNGEVLFMEDVHLPEGNVSQTPPFNPLTPAPRSPQPTMASSPQLVCSDVASIPCPSCNLTFSSTAALRKHTRRAHRPPSFPCPLPHCGKGHLDARALARHLWAKHREYAEQAGTPSERVKCKFCEYEGRRDNVSRHMKRHTGGK